jgi:hypothetical protein
MSLDRFVRWEGEAPTREGLELVLKDYMGESGVVRWDESSGRFWITFARTGGGWYPGEKPEARHSDAHRRVGLATDAQRAYAIECYNDDIRSIEVFVHEDSVDVITRCADDFTNGVAARLAEVLARLFRGIVETG